MTNEEKKVLRPLIEGVFAECNREFNDEMVEDAMKRIEQMCEESSKSPYTYKHPDYKEMVKPVPEALGFLLKDSDELDDLPELDDIMESCSSLERSTLAEAVSSIIYFWMDKWHHAGGRSSESQVVTDEDEDTDIDGVWLYPLHVAILIAERFGLRECLPALLETERQDREFTEAFFDDCNMVGMVPACIYHVITEEDLPMLADFIREQGIYSFCKAEVLAAVSTLPRRAPQTLPAIQKWLCEVLESLTNGIDPADVDVLLLEAVVKCCIHTRCVAAKTMIIRMYSKYKMPNILVPGGVNEVRKTIKKASIGVLKEGQESAEDIFMNGDYYDDEYDDEDDEYDDEDDEYDDEDDEYDDEDDDSFDDYEEIDEEEEDDDDEELAPRQEYNGFAYGGKAHYLPVKVLKRYLLRIELNRSKPLVWRELEIPSSLSLTSLAKAILLAMGWNEDHLHQFVVEGRKHSHYATSENELNSSLFPGIKDGSRYGISHLLQKPGDSVTFEYDYGDSWYHSVTLRSVTEYAANEPKAVILTGGANACPPDDCGGIHRYRRLLELMHGRPQSVELSEFYSWLGSKWDPEYFPLKQAAEAVAKMN